MSNLCEKRDVYTCKAYFDRSDLKLFEVQRECAYYLPRVYQEKPTCQTYLNGFCLNNNAINALQDESKK